MWNNNPTKQKSAWQQQSIAKLAGNIETDKINLHFLFALMISEQSLLSNPAFEESCVSASSSP